MHAHIHTHTCAGAHTVHTSAHTTSPKGAVTCHCGSLTVCKVLFSQRRYMYIHTYIHPHTQTRKHANTQTRKHANTQTRKHARTTCTQRVLLFVKGVFNRAVHHRDFNHRMQVTHSWVGACQCLTNIAGSHPRWFGPSFHFNF